MAGSVRWWELSTPQTPKGYAEAWARIEGGKLEYLPLSVYGKYAGARALEALQALRLRRAPSPEFRWRQVDGWRFGEARALWIGLRAAKKRAEARKCA